MVVAIGMSALVVVTVGGVETAMRLENEYNPQQQKEKEMSPLINTWKATNGTNVHVQTNWVEGDDTESHVDRHAERVAAMLVKFPVQT